MAEQEVRKRLKDNIPEETTFPPTYIVLEFSPNIKEETAEWIIDKIRLGKSKGGMELLVAAQPSDDDHNLTIHISAGLKKLFQLAEEQDILKRDRRGILREFSAEEISEFTHSVDKENLLTLSEKQLIVRHELENIRASANEMCIPGYPKVSLYEGQSILANCLLHGIVKQIYPLHDVEEVKKLGTSWFWQLTSKQPHEEIRLYFGESIALYFQFLGYYTLSLVGPMVLGLVQIFMPPENLAYFSILNIIIATLFLELWRRKCAELAFTWGTITMTSLDEPRPNFRGQMGRDCVSDRLLPQYPRWKTNLKMYCVSLPLVMVCMFGAFLVMLASFKVEEMLQKIDHCPLWIIYMPSTIYAALIYVMNLIYRRFANFLTEWENHRTQSQFDRHRVTKLVLFEFVNNFMSLFYIAFVMQDMEMLSFQLGTLLIVLQIINNLQEARFPFIITNYSTKMKKLSDKVTNSLYSKYENLKSKSPKVTELPGLTILSSDDPRIKQAVLEGMMDKYDDPYDDYLELFVQFGYVFLFSSVYPLAALWAVCNNFIEIRTDAFKLCCIYQRPMSRKVKDIGAWQRAFQALCTLAVMTNCALLCILPVLTKTNETETSWIMKFVILEHILLGLRQILHFAIPDKPEWVKIALARGNYLSKQALKRQGKSEDAYFN